MLQTLVIYFFGFFVVSVIATAKAKKNRPEYYDYAFEDSALAILMGVIWPFVIVAFLVWTSVSFCADKIKKYV